MDHVEQVDNPQQYGPRNKDQKRDVHDHSHRLTSFCQVAWSRIARAQQDGLRRIGMLMAGPASYVDRILRDAKVSDFPVQYPTKLELVINPGSLRRSVSPSRSDYFSTPMN
jgi:hypothetical protein